MLTGTVIGVLVIPGLYYLFGRIADKRSLIADESQEPLSEVFQHRSQETLDGTSTHDHNGNGLPLPGETAESPASRPSEPQFRHPSPPEIPEGTDEKTMFSS
jgi:HAE1 family hydrophobic/amphiphilic exporter-1